MGTHIKRGPGRLALAVALCAAAVAALGKEPVRRTLGVRQGPEKVFDVPIGEIVPALAGAKPTGVNGRVGGELVFWGYTLADGRKANLFACALLADVDCAARVQLVCPSGVKQQESREVPGKLTHRVCRPIATSQPSTARPGCDDDENQANLLAGLVECG
ncbi:MAG TPA: hypothetical protein VFX89_06885 [Gammaproteobacteria bacterium]|nr:hypothetical protein [Gammaproteobacteria bacterium]